MSIRSLCFSNSRSVFCSVGRFSCLFIPAIALDTPLQTDSCKGVSEVLIHEALRHRSPATCRSRQAHRIASAMACVDFSVCIFSDTP